MLNPLVGFHWDRLYKKYDQTCKKYDPAAPYLHAFNDRPCTDRQLYHELVSRARDELSTQEGLSLPTYESIMYWKLYSQPAATKNICYRIHTDNKVRALISQGLQSLNHALPATLARDLPSVKALYRELQQHAALLHGMRSSCSLAVRTTLLHFAYPEVIPLFDKQVLLAVGVREKNANQKPHYLFEYIQHAWALSADPSLIPTNWPETPLRLLDMALWITRGLSSEA